MAPSKRPSWLKFGRWLREARGNANLTQQKVAEQGGLSRSSISEWENGIVKPPSLPQCSQLARALKVPVSVVVANAAEGHTEPWVEAHFLARIGELEDKLSFGAQVWLTAAERDLINRVRRLNNELNSCDGVLPLFVHTGAGVEAQKVSAAAANTIATVLAEFIGFNALSDGAGRKAMFNEFVLYTRQLSPVGRQAALEAAVAVARAAHDASSSR